MRMNALIVLIVATLVFAGCSKDSSPASNTPPPTTQTGTIAITVGGGLNPTYSWTGGGVVTLVVNQTSGTAGPVWGISSTAGANDIASPVTNGTVPASATEAFTTGRTLTAGASYMVQVVRLDASFGTVIFSR